MRSLTLTLVLSLLAPVVLAQPAIVRPGTRVRVDAPGFTGRPTDALVLYLTPDSIVIGDHGLAPLSIPRAAIKALEIGGEKDRWWGAKRGAVLGTKWGLGLGALFAIIDNEECVGGGFSPTPRTCHAATVSDRINMFVGVTTAGAMFGAGIGSDYGNERWEKVELPTHTTVGLRLGRPAVSWSLNF
jgi:hypothetical protein